MRVDDKIRKPIVFIGKQGDRGFVAHGTGFIAASFIDDHGFQQVITAKHVIEKMQSDEIDLRLNTHGGEARILKTKKDWWHFHPDKRVDVAVFPCMISKEIFDLIHLPLYGNTILTDKVILNTGIGVVLPISYVVEAVEQPAIRDRRVASLKARDNRSFVADSVAAPLRLSRWAHLPLDDRV